MANRTADMSKPNARRPPKGHKPSTPGQTDSEKQKSQLKRYTSLKEFQKEFYPEG
jgi:hypothetical protein